MLPAAFLGAATVVALLLYPELALALYVVVGDVKGDDRVAALLPWDLTLALGGVLIAGIILNFLRKKRSVGMPPAYFLFAGAGGVDGSESELHARVGRGTGKGGAISDGDRDRDRGAVFRAGHGCRR